MNNMNWLIRAARWVRNPPSPQMVKMVFAIVAIGLLLAGLQYVGLWPDWATMERPRGLR